MIVQIKYIHGAELALFGIGLSYGLTSINGEMDLDLSNRLVEISRKLCSKDGGHNKFLESITIGMVIQAPRYWWQEFDTYRVGVTKQSESTMHTITKRYLSQDDFEMLVAPGVLRDLENKIDWYRDEKDPYDKEFLFRDIKNSLPEGFLQTRQVTTNFKVLRHIIKQRKTHRLLEWRTFTSEVLRQVEEYGEIYKHYVSEGIF